MDSWTKWYPGRKVTLSVKNEENTRNTSSDYKQHILLKTKQKRMSVSTSVFSLTNLLSAIDKCQEVAVNLVQKCCKLWAFQEDKSSIKPFVYLWDMYYQLVLL